MPTVEGGGGTTRPGCEDPTAHLRMLEERRGALGCKFRAQEKLGEEEVKGKGTHPEPWCASSARRRRRRRELPASFPASPPASLSLTLLVSEERV